MTSLNQFFIHLRRYYNQKPINDGVNLTMEALIDTSGGSEWRFMP